MTKVLLVVMAALAVTPSFAVVIPGDDPLREQEFRHPDLGYENVFRPVSTLPVGVSRTLGSELSRLGVDPGHAFFDLRTGHWGTLILVEPMIPGSGVGNNLEWSSLGHEAEPQGEALEQAVWEQFRDYLIEHAAELRIDPQELAEPSVSAIGDRLIYIHVGRRIDGIAVRGTFVTAAINSGNLVVFGERNWGPVEVSTVPRLSAAEAENVVRGHLEGFPFASLREEPRLELIPSSSQPEEAATFLGAGLEYRLAWVLTPEFEDYMGSWEALVDAHSGELLQFEDTNHYASRRVEGGIFPVSNDGVGDDGTLQFGYPMPFADITLDGTDVGFTTVGGNSPAGSDAGVMATTLSGQFMRMNDVCGAINESSAGGDLDLEGLPLPATDCEVSPGHSPGDTSASRTGFYELNRLNEQARGYLDYPWLDQQLTANMNLNQLCNAFWNGSTVNFFKSGGGCRNTGEIAAIFDHEWGHGVDDNDANPSVSSPGESIADIIGQNRLNTSCIGRGFFMNGNCGGYGDPCLDCSGIRDSDFAKRQSGLPHGIDWILSNCGGGGAPCGRETHCEGTIVAEAAWDFVHRDLQGFEGSPWNLDPNTALELGTRLSYQGSANVGNWYQCTTDGTGGCNADSGYLGFLAADDDDGDITNGTPHMTAIFAAFERHQLSCNAPAVVDSGCSGTPAAPTNVVTDTFDEGMQLTWDAVAGAEEYWIFRTEGVHGCDFGKALVGKTTDTTFSEQGLRNGFEVFYSVSAVGAADSCVSVMSECASAIPTAGPSGFIEGTVTDSVTGDPIEDAAVEAVGPVTVSDATDAAGFYRILAPIGTYDVTADAEDYDPETEPGVEVTEGGTQVIDFALTLTPVPIADISPDSFSFAVQQGNTDSDTLNIGNLGVIDLTWNIAEDDVPAPAHPVLLEEWSDDFDDYETGSQIHGQGGWKGWFNDPAAGALVSDAQAQSTPNSVEVLGATDLVREYVDSNAGQWVYTAWQFIPSDFTGLSYFIMLNSYDDGGSGLNWSVQVNFNGGTETVVNDGSTGGTLPLIRNQWVEIRVEIDIEADTQDFYYNGELLYSGTWTQEVSGGGALNIGAVDLFANGASPVYYDDLALEDLTVAPPCTEPNDVPWLAVTPESGATPPGSTVPVDVTVDATGLDPGELNANLCITTNDPDAELVQIPVALEVLPAGGPVADVTPESFAFTLEEGGSDNDILNLGNLGGQDLTWNIDESESPLLPVIMPEGAPYRYGLAEMPAFNAPVGGDRASGITRARGEAPADRVVLPAPQVQALGDFTEGFDDIQQLPGAGWAMINNSDPEGPSSWFQGNESIFPAHEGAPNAYIAANYESTAGNGTISNWLITPEVQIVNGTEACFWTRKSDLFGEFLDRLEVRMSDEGASTDVGETADSVGDFTTLLLTIEPDLELPNEYPEEWTEFCVTVRERSREPVTGRFAFRYWVTDSGPDGTNGDYIGIDTASVTQPDGPQEGDCDSPVDIPWLAVNPTSGTTPPVDSVPADVNVSAAGLDVGQYNAQLCVNTNDPAAPQIVVPVTLNVVECEFACLEYTPASITADMEPGDVVVTPVTVTNPGAITLEFNVSIGGYEFPELRSDPSPHLIPPSQARFSEAAPIGPLSVRSAEGREVLAESPPSLLWESGAPMPTGLIRYAHTQCADQPESFYTISGVGPGFAIVPDNQRYDADTDSWTVLAPIPVAQEGVSGVCFEGNIYVAGGGGTTQFFIYDIAADSWSAGPALPRPVWGAAMGALDGKVFMIGGDNDFFFGGTSNEVNIYDIAAGTWSSGAPMPAAAVTAGSVQAGNYVYVVGGWGDASPASNVDVSQRYDMAADTWETGPTFTSARADFALAITSENLYAIGGDNNGGGPFDPSALVESLAHGSWPSGEWIDISDPLPQPATAINGGFCTSAVAGGEVWAPGGTNLATVFDSNVFRAAESCFSGGVQWASADPSSGTVPPGGTATFDVIFDASELIQEGTYTASLQFSGNFTNDVPDMPLTLNLTCPTCGTLDGAITDSVSGDPVEATVTIVGDGGFTAEATGETYSVTAPADTYTITAEADGYFPQTIGGIVLGAGETVTTDFALVFMFAELEYTPASIEETMEAGDIVTNTVTVSNPNGTIPLEFSVSIGGYEFPELRSDPSPHLIPPSEARFSAAAPVGPLSVRSAEGREALGEPLPTLLWETGAPMPTGQIRYAHTQCADQPESFYTISGVGPGFAIVPDNQRYDADTDSWTVLAPIPVAQEGVSGVCFEGNIYVAGGGGTTQFFIYDIAADSWSAGPALPRPVWGAAMGALDGKVFMIGGDNDFFFGGTSNEVNIYDIAAGTWSSGAPMPAAAVTAGSVQAGNYVYVVGGWGDASPASNVDATQRYDMAADTWETGPTFTTARADLALAVTSENLYAIGGDNNGGGPFDPSALVESLAHGSWPSGEWTDISDPLPQPATAVNGGFCTSAVAGGEVWAPGGTNLATVFTSNPFRASESCFSGGVQWASADPSSGTVPPGGTATFDVTFDATELVQAGTYTANLSFSGNFNNDVPTMPLTMNLSCPTCGTLDGAIKDSVTGDPVDATVTIVGDGGFTATSTGETYSLTAPADTYSITAEANGYFPQTVEDVVLGVGETVTTNFSLVFMFAELEYTPASIEEDMEAGDLVTNPVTVTNNGTIPLEFSVSIGDYEYPTATEPVRISVPAGVAVAPEGTAAAASGYPLQARPAYTYTDPNGSMPFQTSILIAAADGGEGEPLRSTLLAYDDIETVDVWDARDGFDGVPPLSVLETYPVVITWSNFPYADAIAMGDVLADYVDGGGLVIQATFNWYDQGAVFGLGGRFVSEGYSPIVSLLQGNHGQPANLGDFDAGHPIMQGVTTVTDIFRDWVDLDPDAELVASWDDGEEFIATKGGVVAINSYPGSSNQSSGDIGIIFHNTVNYLLTGLGVQWASADPDSGVVDPGETLTFDVTFDATELVQVGTYTANLEFSGNHNNDVPAMPLTMNLTCPTCGTLDGAITDSVTGDPVEATVTIVGDGGFTAEATGETYSVTAPADTYTITAEADGYFPMTVADVVLEAGETVTTDFALVFQFADLEYTPASIEETMESGDTVTNTVTVSNSGTIDLEYNVSIGGYEYPELRSDPSSHLIAPSEAQFSAAAPVGPLSVRSAEGREALGEQLPSVLWETGAPMPTGQIRYAHVQCAEQPESFYTISGVGPGFAIVPVNQRYDADTDTWTELAPIPVAQEGVSGVCFEGNIYVVGGGGTTQFFIYDIAADSWSAGPALPRGVWGAAMGALDGKVFMIGGDNDFAFGGTSNEVNIYDIAAGTWSSGAPMPAAAVTAGSGQAGNYVYVVGGWGDASPASNVDVSQRYDMAADTWETGPTFASARADFALAVTSENLYAIGGDNNGGGPFDPSALVESLAHGSWPSGEWTDISDPLPQPATAINGGFCTSAVTGGEVWAPGGTNLATVFTSNPFRASESCFSGGVLWASADPSSGTVPPGGSTTFDVTFDATEIVLPGTYTAELRFSGNFNNDPADMPLTMNITE